MKEGLLGTPPTRCPRDDDAMVLERLGESLDRVAAALGELAEEQYAGIARSHGMYLERGPPSWISAVIDAELAIAAEERDQAEWAALQGENAAKSARYQESKAERAQLASGDVSGSMW